MDGFYSLNFVRAELTVDDRPYDIVALHFLRLLGPFFVDFKLDSYYTVSHSSFENYGGVT